MMLSGCFSTFGRAVRRGLHGADDELRQEYFNSYIDTYLMRDVAEAGGIICMCEESIPIDGDNCFIPSNLI